jgi:RNA polymerase sigma-70 factor, ECF subfamily
MRDLHSEEVLLQRLQAGDENAMAELAETFAPRIHQLAFRHLRNREDAEELTQDVLFKVYRKVADFRGDAAVSSWIYRITFNGAMSRLRSPRYRRVHEDGRSAPYERQRKTFRGPEIADSSDAADERVFRSQLRRRTMHAIRALPAIYREPVVLRDVRGMSTGEASVRLKVKDQTLKSRLHRGRLLLRRQLLDFARLRLHPTWNLQPNS